MTPIYLAADAADAQLAVAWLAERGIRAVVEGDNLWIARGDLPLGPGTAPRVIVEDEDAERAAALLAERDAQRTPTHCPACGRSLATSWAPNCPHCGAPVPDPNATLPEWRCTKCGESCEGQFAACWHCGTARTDEPLDV